MDPVTLVLVPGVLGGLVVAWLILKFQRSDVRAADPFHDAPGTDVINMAHIRVAGVGGLGLVAMAMAMAVWVPRIGQTLALAAFLGAVVAAFLILRRRRTGPMPSSTHRPGAHSDLAVDVPTEPPARDGDEQRGLEQSRLAVRAQAIRL